MKKTEILMMAVCFTSAVFGGEYTIKASLSDQIFDWTDGNNFEGGGAPQPGKVDQVRIPDNVNVVISNGISQASLGIINGLIRIRPWGENATLTVYVEEGQTIALDCPINYNWDKAQQGRLVKTGKGTLELNYVNSVTSPNADAFRIDIDVREGVVRFPQDFARASYSMRIKSLRIAKDAFVYPLTPATTEILQGLSGAGTITNEAVFTADTDYKELTISGPTNAAPAVYSGAINGLFSLVVKGNQYFTGTNTTTSTMSIGNSSNFKYGPSRTVNTIGVRKFGRQGDYDVTKFYPSSIGYHNVNFYGNGAHVLCLNEVAETTDKKITVLPPSDGTIRHEVDGGAYGGITFTGDWSMHSTAPNVRRLYLTGSNTEHACVLANRLLKATKDGADYSFTFVKEGPGIWRFADTDANASKRTTAGLLAVRDGTVEVESIAEKGTACCFGTSSKPYPSDYYETTTDPLKMADYAIELGGTSTTGTLAYVGASSVRCTTRKIAMTGFGRLENRSDKNFDWSGVCSVGADARTLILDGDDTSACNTLDDVTDTDAGALSLVKEGAGSWRVKSNVSVRGNIAVRNGTLVLDDATRYTWYKWVIKSTYSEAVDPTPANTITLKCGEFGLYATDGHRQNLNLSYRRLAYPNLKPGEVDYGFTDGDGFSPDTRSGNYWEASCLLDNSVATGHALSFWYNTTVDRQSSGTNRNAPHHLPAEKTTWLPVVMRLSEDALPVSRFDYANIASKNAAAVYRTVLYASTNGSDWEVVAPEAALEPKAAWQLADRPFIEGGDDVHTNALGQVDGQEIAAFPASVTGNYLKDVESYSVDPGATLKIFSKTTIKGLTVDGKAQGCGRILGGTLASSGTVTIEGLGRAFDPVELPISFEGVGGLENIKHWTYCLANGKVLNPALMRVTVANGKVTVACSAPGLMLIVR